MRYELTNLWAMQESALRALAAAPIANVNENEDHDEQVHTVKNGVAIVPVVGTLTKYPSFFGGTSTLQLKNTINRLANDSTVSGIILWIDSPGGEASGTEEAAMAIANCGKPTTAVISDMCASGAYWIASQCDSVVANETAQVGSIGVYMLYPDTSKMYEDMGVKWNLVKAGVRKGVGAPGIPISEDDLQGDQEYVNEMHSLFISTVAKARGNIGNSAEWSTGDTFISGRAKELGLIDGIGNIQTAFFEMGTRMNTSDITQQLGASGYSGVTTAVEANEQLVAQTEAVVEAPKAEATDIHDQLANAKAEGYAEGVKDSSERFAEVLKACGNRHELAATEFLAGHYASKAREAYAAQLEKELLNAQTSVSSGSSLTVAVTGAQPSSKSDPEADWLANEEQLKAVYGAKDIFIANREYEMKTGKKAF